MPLHPASSSGYGCSRIENALIRAGVVLIDAPAPGVMLNPDRRYDWLKRPPIYERRGKANKNKPTEPPLQLPPDLWSPNYRG